MFPGKSNKIGFLNIDQKLTLYIQSLNKKQAKL